MCVDHVVTILPSPNALFIPSVMGEILPAVELKRVQMNEVILNQVFHFKRESKANDGSLNELFYYFLSPAA